MSGFESDKPTPVAAPLLGDTRLTMIGNLARSLQQELSDIGPRVVAMLNQAFLADPAAIHALMCNRVPCNEQLADDPYVIVDCSGVVGIEQPHVGALGLINGVLLALDQPDVVALVFTDVLVDAVEGRRQFLGFKLIPRNDDFYASKTSGEIS